MMLAMSARRIFRILIIALSADIVILAVGLYASVLVYPWAPPMQQATAFYQQHVTFILRWPFFYKYYLYVPPDAETQEPYPLVVLLHGVSRHMYGGRYILADRIQQRHPSFVLVPIAPLATIWGAPGADDSDQMAVALPLIRDAIMKVESAYKIDQHRIYISGYSMGGVGTFAAIKAYPNLFAAAIPLCGNWDPSEASVFPQNVPVFAFHGSNDNPSSTRLMIDALRASGHRAYYREYPDVGHNVWDYVYSDLAVWDWLFDQRRADSQPD